MPRLPLPLLALAVAGLQSCIAVYDTDHGRHETTLEVIELQNAAAGELAASLAGLLEGQSSGASAVSFVADERTNSIVIRGPRDEVAQVRATIEKLDRRIP